MVIDFVNKKVDKLQFIGEFKINSVVGATGVAVGSWSPAVTNRIKSMYPGRRGAVPYGFKRLPIRYRRRILSGFVVVGVGALDDPQNKRFK